MAGTAAGGSAAIGRVNSLGLSRRQLDLLLNRIDAPIGFTPGVKRRLHLRWTFRQESLRFAVVHPGGNSVEFHVAGRNLSGGGASILHSAFVYPGSACRLWLPHPALREVEVVGRIVRCTHIHRMIHELGVSFDAPIRVREFIPGTDECTLTLETIKPRELTGRLLCVADSELDQRVVRHFLRETQLEVAVASNRAEATAALARGCELVLCDEHLADGACAGVIHAIRRHTPDLPVVVAASDAGAAERARALSLRVNAFIVKPFTPATLLRTLGEILLLRA